MSKIEEVKKILYDVVKGEKIGEREEAARQICQLKDAEIAELIKEIENIITLPAIDRQFLNNLSQQIASSWQALKDKYLKKNE